MGHAERIGRFEIEERIRGSCFALVYRGHDPFDSRSVHIKVCVAGDPGIRRRFLLAAEQAARLHHKNIASVFEFGSGDSKPYLVQEAFSERSLGDLLGPGEPVDDVFKLYYLVQIARGLQHAHAQGVLHREVRAASVLVQTDGAVKLADFGIARLESAYTRLGEEARRRLAVGWLLPELLLGLELDRRSDVYGFGAVAYELLTGGPPFVADSLAALVSKVLEEEPAPVTAGWAECPAELDRLILRCLERDPGKRFESMDGLIEELDVSVPVTAPADVVEQQKTLVTTELQTVYVAESAEPEPQQEAAAAASHRPADWRPRWVTADAWLRRGAAALRLSLQTRLASAAGRLSTAVGWWRPRWRLDAARLRAGAIVVGAVLLFGVVGWSLVRGPDPEAAGRAAPSSVQPTAPSDRIAGKLIVNASPWAEVVRIAGPDGREVALPSDRLTPLFLELSPGRYEVLLARPDQGLVASCAVEVTASRISRCSSQIAPIEAAEYFKQTGWWQ